MAGELDATLLPGEKCWIEAGHFDKDGHDQQSRMADGIGAALAEVAAKALRLAREGRRLRICTDHGWLLLPGGLPVADLPAGLTETRWRRCAVVKEGAATTATQLPWSWNKAVPIAIAPGAHVFVSGAEYAHGGISPQESIVPELLVMPLAGARRAVIVDVEWSGLRVRLRAEGADGLSPISSWALTARVARSRTRPVRSMRTGGPVCSCRTIRLKEKRRCWNCAIRPARWSRRAALSWEVERWRWTNWIACSRSVPRSDRAQGSRAPVPRPVSGSDLCRRIYAGPLLRICGR